MSEKKILVSGCLFGWHCRYDDGNTDTIIEGQGLAVEYLRNAGYKVFSENMIEEVIKALAK